MENMERNILFKLKFIKGISNLQVHRLLENCEDRGISLDQLSPYDMAVFANLTKTKAQFLYQWHTVEEKFLEEQLEKHQFITILDEAYPEYLREMYNAPIVFFYKGDISLLKKLTLSVVGSRIPSDVGIQTTKKIVQALATDFVIVSGLAAGIDGIAHKVAISSAGKTIGVIGCGLDIYYPKHHEKLQKHMEKEHLVLSEYPNETPPRRHHFPERNRIIAGLSMGTVVLEAKIRSGSLITCEFAMNNGREVFAVPGETLTGRNDGCHHLIQEGAKCVFKVEDILEELL